MFQYINHVSDCSVQCAKGIKPRNNTTKTKLLFALSSVLISNRTVLSVDRHITLICCDGSYHVNDSAI